MPMKCLCMSRAIVEMGPDGRECKEIERQKRGSAGKMRIKCKFVLSVAEPLRTEPALLERRRAHWARRTSCP